MKRIANNVALQTVLYSVSGLQRIRVLDYKTTRAYLNREYVPTTSELVFDGLVKDIIGYHYTRALRSAVYSIDVDVIGGDPVITFCIATDSEDF